MISTRFNPIGKNLSSASVATCFEVTTTSDNTTFSFASDSQRALATDSSSYSIDWGDGTVDTYTDVSTVPSHSYATTGKYIVTISDDLHTCCSTSSVFGTNTLVTRAISWGSKLENVKSFYQSCSNLTGTIPEWNNTITDASWCYSVCSNLTGTIPEWNNTITDASGCYNRCSNLTGTIPKWNDVITNATYCYSKCSNLTGSIPEWNDVITNATYCYSWCANLTGSIPEWNNTIKRATSCYTSCTGLTGTIPKWNDVIINAQSCYSSCKNLTGIWDENATPGEIMPSHITTCGSCVFGTSATLRAYFYDWWGGTRAR